ncbi:galactosyltransferase-related protein [Alienimonas chondri]|nr:galactosyltransferase-related protein [Alienimonas chondri]
MRAWFGCWLHERWRAELAMLLGSGRWRGLCNRSELLTPDPAGGSGFACRWEDSSDLTVGRVFPSIAARLLTHALPAVSLRWAGVPTTPDPAVSVLVPAGGDPARRPLLELVLAALAAEAAATPGGAEVILAEQLRPGEPAADGLSGVRQVAVRDGGPFNKSRLLNRAAAIARAPALVIHDADYLPAPGYLARCGVALARSAGVRPGRLIFYVDRLTTEHWVAGLPPDSITCPSGHLETTGAEIEKVVQNNPTPLAIRRSAYFSIGGHDEAFEGWGGEDAEFLSRLRILGVDEYGTEPLIHLWHPPAPKKVSGDRNESLHAARSAESPAARIVRLRGGWDPVTLESGVRI